jgi:malate dehydrogenase (oxaloacetate-decarboxylating)(NADP+)
LTSFAEVPVSPRNEWVLTMSDDLRDAALEYHRSHPPGKISVTPTKPLATQRDLALAYSPGVAAACEVIVADPAEASRVTARGNLVAVITNGTAVLGLGAIGPLAAKPVMEGKGVLFKKFAGIDVFDIEIAENDPVKLVEVIAALEPTFGGINLEDIKAPECFYVEQKLRERMKIPVFHDDQHGTAIIVAAAITNALALTGRDIGTVKLVVSGAGAAALACLDLLVDLGMAVENIWVSDIAGVVWQGRTELMDPRKARYAKPTNARTLGDIIEGADIFLGLSAPRVLTGEMVGRMAARPVVMALANPTPEIMPDEVRAARPDAIIATGRSDFPNQVNNVLCFPFIFRGALDVGATSINEAMKVAAVRAIAALARAEAHDVVATAYGETPPGFGPDYLIPRPFDPRLILEIAPAVARAAMETGVATRPIRDFPAYVEQLSQFVFRSGLVMKPVFARAKQAPKRIVYAEGEEERVLRAAQQVIDDGLARPILVGRRDVIRRRIERLGLRLRIDEDFRLVDPQSDPAYHEYWTSYHAIMERRGVSPDRARQVLRANTTVIGSMMLSKGEADALICGSVGLYDWHLRHVRDVIGRRPGIGVMAALSVLILNSGTFFLADTYVNDNPSPAELAEIASLAAEEVRRFGLVPKVALLSHSSFGSHDDPEARKMRQVLTELTSRYPELEVEGEMHSDAAISEEIRRRVFPNSRLQGTANLLIMTTRDTANVAFNLLKVLADGLAVGPVLLGAAKPAHILTPSVTVRGIVNMSALAVVDAQMLAAGS